MGVALVAAVVLGVLGWWGAWRSGSFDGPDTSYANHVTPAVDAQGPRKISLPFKPGKLPDLDLRSADGGTNKLHESRDVGAAALRRKVPGVQIDFDLITGGPKNITAPGRFLNAADKSAKAGGDVYEPVRRFLDENRELFGHSASALAAANARVTREDVTAHNGMRTVVWQQALEGIPLFQTIFRASLTKNGDILTLGGNFIPDPAAASKIGAAQRSSWVAQPTVSAVKAVTLAAADIGAVVDEAAIKADGAVEGTERRQRFKAPAISDTSAQLSWVPMSADSIRLAWDVTVMSTQRGEMFRVLVDAQTGGVLVRLGLTNYISNATFRVYAKPDLQPYDSPTPFAPGHSTPSSAQPAEVNRNAITLQAENVTASPNGWINDGVTQTLGNNVDAHTDTDANNSPDLPRPTSATRNFDFAMDLTQAPSTYKDAAVTNLFYLCNWIHDKLYALGFTESAGNFQTDNFGRGGNGNDAVMADAQDGSGTNNANFSTPGDGSPGRMQMYVFTGPTPDRDGDFDHEIVIHEYAHGLSNRLVGGGVGMSANQSQGMGEGWSDFYGLSLLSEASDDPNGCYAAGGYATRQFAGLAENYYFGIRRYPYSTDMLKNPLTFKDIDPAQASSHSGIPRSSIIGTTANEVHNEGEVWCVALWDARANLIAKHGWATGNQLILQLVTDGMKLAPADPNFLQARDAIIQADLVSNAGANRNELWAAFAKRGMGANATSPSSNTTTGLVESFEMPDDLGVNPAAVYLATGEVGGPFSPASNAYTLSNSGTASLNWTASVNQPWITLSSASGTLAGSSTVVVTATVNAAAASLANGLYNAVITFTNTTSSAAVMRNVTLRAGQIDYFTELFDSGAQQDIDGFSFTFTPNASASGYSVLKDPVSAFPTDPAGGASLTMSDDTSVQVTLTGTDQVALYGVPYSTFHIGSNGFVTFSSGDIAWVPTLNAHFSQPRIAALFNDLLPTTGQVTWKQLVDRAAVTWSGVKEYGTTNSNSVQIEMFFDGRIRITHLAVDATTGLIGLSRGTGTPADFTESDFSAYFNLTIALAMPASAVEGVGVLAGQGSVSRSVATASPLTVSLVSGDVTELAVPAEVIIAANETSVSFDLTIGDDTLLDGTRSIGVTASAAGAANASGAMLIHDNETTAITLSLPATVTEGDTGVQGSVTLGVAAGRAIAIELDSSDKNNLALPATVTVPAGQTSVTFPVTVIDDNRIENAQVINATAAVQGWPLGTATVILQDNEPRVLSVTLPSSMLEGEMGKLGSVSVSGVLTADLVVDLTSDDPTELTVPATVTLLAGESSGSFPINIINDADLDGAQPVQVTASAASYTSGIQTGTVLDDETPAAPTNPSPAHLQSNTHPDANLAWSFATGTGGTPDSYQVFFGTNPTPGVAELLGTTTTPAWTLPLLTAGTTYHWQIVSKKGTASVAGPVWQFSVPVGGPPVRYVWSAVPSPQLVDGPFAASITGYDASDIPSTSFNGEVDILPVAGAAIVITEINPNTPDAIEFTNVSSAPVDVSGWEIHIYDNVSYPDPLSVFTIPAGTTCDPGEVFRIQEDGVAPGTFPSFFYGGNIDWTSASGSATAVLLRKADGALVDFACATAGSPASISSPVAIPVTQWSGATIAAPSIANRGYARTGNFDANTAADWIAAIPGIGTINPALTVPFPGENLVVDPPSVTLNTGTWSGTIRVRTETPAAILTARDASGNHGETNVFAVNLIGSLSLAGSETAVIENAGTVPTAFAITLSAAAPYEMTVALTSSAPALAASTSVVVPAGQTTASAPLVVTDDALLNGSRTVTFAASAPGFSGAAVNVRVDDNETATLNVSAPLQVTEGQGTLVGQGSVTVSAAVDVPVTVALLSSDASEIVVPPSVVIPAGQTVAAFDITVPQDSVIDGAQTVTIRAQVAGWTDVLASVEVLDDEARTLAFTIAPTSEEGAGNLIGTVSTSAVMGADLVVNLSSNDTTEAGVPLTVTIPAGQSSATFSITIVDDVDADGAQTVGLSAAAATFTGAAHSLIVRDNEVHHFTLAPIVGPKIRNAPFPITISARSVDEQVITSFAAAGNLSAGVPVAPTVTGNFIAGEWTGDVTMGAYGSGVQITFASAGGQTGSSNGFDVTHGPLHHFAWGVVASPQFKGVPFGVGITALDVAGNVVADFTGTAGLSSATVTISPVVSGPFVAGVWSGNVTAQQVGTDVRLVAASGAMTGQSNAFQVDALGALTVNLSAGSASESAGIVSGSVQIAAARVVDVVVALTSSDATEVAQPGAVVTIPAGQSSAPISVAVVDDSELDGPQSAVVSATALGYDPGSATLIVTDNETTTITVTLPASPVENSGLIVGGGAVTLGAAPTAAITVQLSSSDTSELTVPSSVTIPAGQTSAVFDVTFVDDVLIDGSQNVTVLAHVDGWTDGSGSASVQDDESRSISVDLPFPTTESVGSITGAVSIAGLLPTDLVISLSSSSPADLIVPASVTIPAGGTSVNFTAQIVDDALPEATESVTVSASGGTLISGNGLTFITDNDPAAFVFSPVPASWIRNVPNAVTITAVGIGGGTMASFGGVASLSAAGDGGNVNLTPITTGSFTSGVWTGSVTMLGTGTNVRITAVSGAITGTSGPFTVTQAPLDRFVWDAVPPLQFAGIPFPVVLHARDAYGNDVNDYSGTVNLTAQSNAPPTEVTIGGATSTIGVLLGTASHDVRSQVIHTPAEVGGAGVLSSMSLYLSSVPGQTLTNWTIRMKHTTRANFATDKSWESSDWTVVHQSDQTVASTGWVAFPFTTNFEFNGTDNLLVDFSFNNSSSSTNGLVRYTTGTPQRTMYASSNSTAGDPLTWSGITPTATVSSTIWNVKLTKAPAAIPVSPSVAGTFVNGVWTGSVSLGSEILSATLRAADGSGHTGDSTAFEVLSSPLTLNAEPAYTGGTSNAVTWTSKGAGIEYEAERGTGGSFSTAVSSGWLTAGATSHSFTGLDHAATYEYRVRMRRSGVWLSEWSPVVSSTQDALPPVLTLQPGSEVFTTLADFALLGGATDAPAGVSSVTVNSAAVSTANAFGAWSKSLPGLTSGANTFIVIASDQAVPPNTTTATLTVQRIATPASDADGDGVSDLMEGALHLNTAVGDAWHLPVTTLQTNSSDGKQYLTFQYRRRIQHAGFRYMVETSTTLEASSWSSTGDGIEEITTVPTGDGVTETCTVRLTPATDAVARKFVRLRVELD